jgi:hypothetical protein
MHRAVYWGGMHPFGVRYKSSNDRRPSCSAALIALHAGAIPHQHDPTISKVVPHDERARMLELGIGDVETIVMAVK